MPCDLKQPCCALLYLKFLNLPLPSLKGFSDRDCPNESQVHFEFRVGLNR